MKKKKWALLAAGLAAAVMLAGCGQIYTRAMTIDGMEISAGMYLYHQLNAYSLAGSLSDNSSNLLNSKVEGENAVKWIQNKAVENCLRYVAVERECQRRDIQLSDENRASLDSMLSMWAYSASIFEANGISQETWGQGMGNEAMGQQLFETLYEEGGELAPTEAEIMADYEEGYAHLRYISIPLTKGDYTEYEDPDEIEGIAGQMVQQMEAGATMEEVADGLLVGIYELLGRDFSGTAPADVIYTVYQAYDEPGGNYPEELLETMRAQPVGAVGMQRNADNILLYEKIPVFANEEEYTSQRAIVVNALYTEAFDQWLEEIYSAYTVNKVPGAQAFLSPKKIIMPSYY